MYKGEKTNSITHLVGAVLALAGLVLLIVFSSLTGDPWKIVSTTIYGVTLLILFTNSTLYHSFRGRAKRVFQILDHISIYLLIAGTYTPFCLILIRDGMGWWIFGLVWGVAVFGTIFKGIWRDRFNLLSTLFYILAGWTAIIDISTVYQRLPPAGFFWLATGGILYTVGAVFFLIEKMPRNHEVWHFFVLGGAASHFVAVFFYLI